MSGSENADAEDAIAANKETLSGFIVGTTDGAHLAEVGFIAVNASNLACDHQPEAPRAGTVRAWSEQT